MPIALRLGVVRFALDVQFWFPTWYFLLMEQGFTPVQAVQADALFHLVILLGEIPASRLVTRVGRARSLRLTTAATAVVFLLLSFTSGHPMLLATWGLWGLLWAIASGLDTAYTWEVAESGYVGTGPSPVWWTR